MKKTITSRAAMLCAGALLAAAGAAQAALQDRDLDGDTVVDAFYDTELDITWLRNGDVNGQMDWDTAVAWADGFSFAGYDDWRLPTTLRPDPSCSSHSGGEDFGYNCTGSEMGHLWYVELGNTAGGPMTHTGDFQNLQSYYYWSGTEYTPVPDHAWTFRTYDGYQYGNLKSNVFYALAVRPGDVPVIPEPQTYALMLAGLTALWVARRRAR